MIEHSASLSSFQKQLMHTTSRGVLHQYYSLNTGVKNLAGHLANEAFIERDRETFTRLLRLIVSEQSSKCQTINLNTNHELSRLIPVLFTYFSPEELAELFVEKLTNDILY